MSDLAKNGNSRNEQMFSALHSTTDIARTARHVRFVPTAEVTLSHKTASKRLKRARQSRWTHRNKTPLPLVTGNETLFSGRWSASHGHAFCEKNFVANTGAIDSFSRFYVSHHCSERSGVLCARPQGERHAKRSYAPHYKGE
jgi:hypothetical protein